MHHIRNNDTSRKEGNLLSSDTNRDLCPFSNQLVVGQIDFPYPAVRVLRCGPQYLDTSFLKGKVHGPYHEPEQSVIASMAESMHLNSKARSQKDLLQCFL